MRVWLVYVRKSVVRYDSDLESPERQLHICKARLELAEKEPYEIEVYQDLDRSGWTEAGRPEWLRLKEQLARPEVIGVVSSSLDRLYRNVREFLAFLNEVEAHGKALMTARESLDTSNPLGRFVVTILMAMFELEARMTSTRMKEMVEDKRRRQGRHWGVAPFGCDRGEGGQLVPSERAYTLDNEIRYYHDALVECFKLYATGDYSYEQVAEILNAAGWLFYDRYEVPGEWNEERVRGVINRWQLYRGDLPMGNPLKNHKRVDWVNGGHQPILPVELCDAVGLALGDRGRMQWSRVGQLHRIYPLSGLLHCGRCGMALKGQYQNGRLYRHEGPKAGCPEDWATNAEALETEVFKAMLELIEHPQVFDDIGNDLDRLKPQKRDNRKQVDEIRGRLNRLEDLYIDGGDISKASYLERRSKLLSELSQLQADVLPGPGLFESIEQIKMSLYAFFDAEEKTKKALISSVIQRFEVVGGAIHSLTPKDWAKPFFSAYCEWAGWESGTGSTSIPIIVSWFNNANVET